MKYIFSQGYFLTIIAFCLLNKRANAQQVLSFNHDWQFTSIPLNENAKARHLDIGKNWNDQFTTESVTIGDSAIGDKTWPYMQEMARLKGQQWKTVSLPHIAFPEPLPIDKPREGIAYYRKTFTVPASYKGKSITIEFEGAMQIAWVWFNGQFVKQHVGGYLPFTIDISKLARYGQSNIITVKLDNRANPLVPPGKPVNRMDFIYYSGIYRDVWLHVSNPLHITDANVIDRKAGGGIFVTYPQVGRDKAFINIQTNIINEGNKTNQLSLVQQLLDNSGKIAAQTIAANNTLAPGQDAHYQQQMEVIKPALWSPDSPSLYKLRTIILRNNKKIDERVTMIGIRGFSISKDQGVLINGNPVRMVGTNRHMNYPWIGNALSNNANYRDAILIKQAGMNCIRLAHYPQDPSFYDACDSLGILLVDCVPGWQFLNKSEAFANNTLDDTRQMIRRDRNHPSILLWEVSLNETYPSADFRCRQVEVAKSEWPSGINFYTSGDSYFTKACYDVPYDDWADNIAARNNTTYPDNAFLIREYGDFEFGGVQSTSRQLRGNGETGLLQQAWNLQWEHNRNRQQYPRAVGDLTWAFFDGLAGYVYGIEGWGLADIKRIPKFSYYFFQSQQRNNAKPMCYIANYWTPRDTVGNVVVYSNCDEVRLLINGKETAHQLPDNGPDTPYGTELDKGGRPFDGGNVKGMDSPPFTFKNITFAPGELKAVGYKGGRPVAEYKVNTPGKVAKIKLSIATQGIPLKADGADVVFVHAQLVDANGHFVPLADNEVTFTVQGGARLLSPSTIKAEAGIATILLQAGIQKGKVQIKAYSRNTPEALININTY